MFTDSWSDLSALTPTNHQRFMTPVVVARLVVGERQCSIKLEVEEEEEQQQQVAVVVEQQQQQQELPRVRMHCLLTPDARVRVVCTQEQQEEDAQQQHDEDEENNAAEAEEGPHVVRISFFVSPNARVRVVAKTIDEIALEQQASLKARAARKIATSTARFWRRTRFSRFSRQRTSARVIVRAMQQRYSVQQPSSSLHEPLEHLAALRLVNSLLAGRLRDVVENPTQYFTFGFVDEVRLPGKGNHYTTSGIAEFGLRLRKFGLPPPATCVYVPPRVTRATEPNPASGLPTHTVVIEYQACAELTDVRVEHTVQVPVGGSEGASRIARRLTVPLEPLSGGASPVPSEWMSPSPSPAMASHSDLSIGQIASAYELIGVHVSRCDLKTKLGAQESGGVSLHEMNATVRRQDALESAGVDQSTNRNPLFDLFPLMSRSFDAHHTVECALRESKERVSNLVSEMEAPAMKWKRSSIAARVTKRLSQQQPLTVSRLRGAVADASKEEDEEVRRQLSVVASAALQPTLITGGSMPLAAGRDGGSSPTISHSSPPRASARHIVNRARQEAAAVRLTKLPVARANSMPQLDPIIRMSAERVSVRLAAKRLNPWAG